MLSICTSTLGSLILWNLANDNTASARDLAERRPSEIVDVDVIVVGTTDGVLDASEPYLQSYDAGGRYCVEVPIGEC